MTHRFLTPDEVAILQNCIDNAFYRLCHNAGLHYKNFELVGFDYGFQEYEDGFSTASKAWHAAMTKMLGRRLKFHYSAYRHLIYKLDDEAWKITVDAKTDFELQRTPCMAIINEGMNLIFQSLCIYRWHWCPDWDFLLITEYDDEWEACTCINANVAGTRLLTPLTLSPSSWSMNPSSLPANPAVLT